MTDRDIGRLGGSVANQISIAELARRDQLILDLVELVHLAVDSEVLTPLIDPQVDYLVDELEGLLVRSKPWTERDREALRTVTQAHFLRWQALSNMPAEAERGAYIGWASEFMAIAPREIPYFVRADLASAWTPHAAYERALETFREFMRIWGADQLHQARRDISEAVDGASPKDPHLPIYLHLQGTILAAEYDRERDSLRLNDAVARFRAALDTCSLDDPHAAIYMADLGSALRGRYQQLGEQCDLTASITCLESAVGNTLAGYPERKKFLSQLSHSLRARFDLLGSKDDLDRAIDLCREALLPAEGNTDESVLLSSLANSLCARYSISRDVEDLHEAISALSSAIDFVPEHHPNLPTFESNLVLALHLRYERFGNYSDLENAITVGRHASANASEAQLDTQLPKLNLAVVLKTRYDVRGQLSDLDDAITLYQEVLTKDNGIGTDVLIASNLGAAYMCRYNRTFDSTDLDQAVTFCRKATDSPASRKAGYLSNLGSVLLERYRNLHSIDDLVEAIAALRESLASTPEDHDELASRLFNLASVLLLQFQTYQQPGDLNESIASASQAVERTPSDHPDLAIYLQGLSSSLSARAQSSNKLEDTVKACMFLKRAAELSVASPQIRLHAASTWAWCEAENGNAAAALDAYQLALDLLPSVAWHGIDRHSQERILSQLSHLPSQAASWALEADQPERSVNLLEAARGILWAQILQLRTDLTKLRVCHPQLADSLESVRLARGGPGRSTSAEAIKELLDSRRYTHIAHTNTPSRP